MIVFFVAQVQNDDIPKWFFHFFKIYWLLGGRGLKWQKMVQNDEKFCLTSYLRNCTSYDCDFWYTFVKWWYLQQSFSFFQKSDFSAFSKFINKCQKEILRCVPPSSHVCDFFVKLWLILFQLELSRTELPKFTPDCTTMDIVTIPFVLFYQFYFIWPSQFGLTFWKVYLWARSFL